MDAAQLAKPASLVLLAVQNFAYGILLPLSRKPDADGNQFYAPSSVVVMEFMKIGFAVVGILLQRSTTTTQETTEAGQQYQPLLNNESQESLEEGGGGGGVEEEERGKNKSTMTTSRGSLKAVCQHVRVRVAEASQEIFTAQAFRMAVPAILYVVQNNLQMISGGYLDSTEFQVLSQLKLVSTAIFSVWLLGKRLSRSQWASIAVLFVGTASVQYSSMLSKAAATASPSSSSSSSNAMLYGTSAIVLACLCSGLAGVLIEMQLKKKTNFWVTNLHLSIFSLVPALVPIFTDSVVRSAFQPLRYFNAVVWSTIFVNAVGGVLVALVLKFADNILKGFAICAALLATVFYNAWISGQPFSVLQFIGASFVAASTIWYANSPPPPPSSSPSSCRTSTTTEEGEKVEGTEQRAQEMRQVTACK